MIKYVIKRDGRKKEYNGEFIKQAIKNAYVDVYKNEDKFKEEYNFLQPMIENELNKLGKEEVEVEEIQDIVVKVLNTVCKRVAKSYQYSVRLIEQLSNGKLYGISNASESSLNSETKKNFLGEIKEDYIVDFSSAKSLDDAKNALASDNVGGCTKDILTGFYN